LDRRVGTVCKRSPGTVCHPARPCTPRDHTGDRAGAILRLTYDGREPRHGSFNVAVPLALVGEGKPCPSHVEQGELAVSVIGFLREANAIGCVLRVGVDPVIWHRLFPVSKKGASVLTSYRQTSFPSSAERRYA